MVKYGLTLEDAQILNKWRKEIKGQLANLVSSV